MTRWYTGLPTILYRQMVESPPTTKAALLYCFLNFTPIAACGLYCASDHKNSNRRDRESDGIGVRRSNDGNNNIPGGLGPPLFVFSNSSGQVSGPSDDCGNATPTHDNVSSKQTQHASPNGDDAINVKNEHPLLFNPDSTKETFTHQSLDVSHSPLFSQPYSPFQGISNLNLLVPPHQDDDCSPLASLVRSIRARLKQSKRSRPLSPSREILAADMTCSDGPINLVSKTPGIALTSSISPPCPKIDRRSSGVSSPMCIIPPSQRPVETLCKWSRVETCQDKSSLSDQSGISSFQRRGNAYGYERAPHCDEGCVHATQHTLPSFNDTTKRNHELQSSLRPEPKKNNDNPSSEVEPDPSFLQPFSSFRGITHPSSFISPKQENNYSQLLTSLILNNGLFEDLKNLHKTGSRSQLSSNQMLAGEGAKTTIPHNAVESTGLGAQMSSTKAFFAAEGSKATIPQNVDQSSGLGAQLSSYQLFATEAARTTIPENGVESTGSTAKLASTQTLAVEGARTTFVQNVDQSIGLKLPAQSSPPKPPITTEEVKTTTVLQDVQQLIESTLPSASTQTLAVEEATTAVMQNANQSPRSRAQLSPTKPSIATEQVKSNVLQNVDQIARSIAPLSSTKPFIALEGANTTIIQNPFESTKISRAQLTPTQSLEATEEAKTTILHHIDQSTQTIAIEGATLAVETPECMIKRNADQLEGSKSLSPYRQSIAVEGATTTTAQKNVIDSITWPLTSSILPPIPRMEPKTPGMASPICIIPPSQRPVETLCQRPRPTPTPNATVPNPSSTISFLNEPPSV